MPTPITEQLIYTQPMWKVAEVAGPVRKPGRDVLKPADNLLLGPRKVHRIVSKLST